LEVLLLLLVGVNLDGTDIPVDGDLIVVFVQLVKQVLVLVQLNVLADVNLDSTDMHIVEGDIFVVLVALEGIVLGGVLGHVYSVHAVVIILLLANHYAHIVQWDVIKVNLDNVHVTLVYLVKQVVLVQRAVLVAVLVNMD
jgi:hypothetical protein